MADDIIVQVAETFTLVGVLVAFAIFARLAIKARTVGTFRFQLSIFILIWAIAEIPHIAETLGFASVASIEDLGLTVHMVSMSSFATFIGYRSYGFLRVKQISLTPPPATEMGVTGALES